MNDLVKRISIHAHCGEDCVACDLLREAADELERKDKVIEVARDLHYCYRLERGMVCAICNALAEHDKEE